MKHLYIIRHAKSSWKDSSIPDIERPLNKRGKISAPVIGNALSSKGTKVDLIICSPAKRTKQTAQIIAEKIGYKNEIIFIDKLYAADLFEILAQLKGIDEAIKNLMVVGHNPGITDLLNFLSNSNIDNIPTCGVIKLEIEKPWKDIDENCARLLFFIYPKMFI